METQHKGLKFHSFNVNKILFERGSTASSYKFAIQMKRSIDIDKENSNVFYVSISVDASSSDSEKPILIRVETVGHFEIIDEVDESVINNYRNISAPSILYPYVRAFLSNLTLQSGLNPINLPPINFAS
jgi:preprotein translocase subunit SecB